MKKFLLSILCCLLCFIGLKAEVVTDVLTQGWTGRTTTSYGEWSEKTLNSDAVYRGQSAGGNSSIQLRSSNSNSGIVTTESGGKVRKVTVVWHSSTASGRTLDIYGKNEAYTSATNLYNSSTQGTKLGSIKYGTSTELEIEGDYEYIGLRSNSGAMYLTSISITWEYEATGEVKKPEIPTLPATCNFVGSMEVEIVCATDDADIYYTTDGTDPTEESEPYSGAFDITETTTVKAIAVNEAGASNVATAVYTRVAATPVIYFEDATFEESVVVTITAGEGTTAYYTLNGKTPNEDSDECPETLTLKADATLQVIAYDEDGYASPVVKQAFKKSASDAAGGTPTGTATLVTDVADLAVGDKVVIVATNYDVALSTTQNNNNRGQAEITKNGNDVTLNENVQILTLENGTVDGTFAFNTGSGYLYAASSGSNHLRTQGTNNANGSWKIDIDEGVATVKAQGTNTRNWLRYNSATNNGKIFSCYASGQTDVSLYKVNLSSIEDYVLNVSAAGWATLYLGYNVIIPEDVNCYVISEVGAESVNLEEVTGVLPANTGVIVEAEAGAYTFDVADATVDVESVMTGTTKNEYITEDAYVLSMVDGVVGLYQANKAGGVFLNNANKAYLPASAVPAAVQGASGFKFRFETTGVEQVEVAKGVKAIYDLSGRKVNDMKAPGLYIVNGKKVLVK